MSKFLLMCVTMAMVTLTGCQSLKRRQAATEAPPPATLRHKAFRPFAPPARPQPPAFDHHDPLFGDPDVGNGFSPPAPAKPKSPVRQSTEDEYVREPLTREQAIGGILTGVFGLAILVWLGRSK